MSRLHHVNVIIPVGTTVELAVFYADVLGLTRTTKPSEGTTTGGAWFDLSGGTQVHLSERAGASHPDQHFALIVDDFDDLMGRLAAAGAPWTDQPDLFGGRRGFTRDPAGNRIEICEAP